MRKEAERFAPFLGEGFGLSASDDVEAYCKREVEPMGKECEQIQIVALIEYLGVVTEIEYLDGRYDERIVNIFHQDRLFQTFRVFAAGLSMSLQASKALFFLKRNQHQLHHPHQFTCYTDQATMTYFIYREVTKDEPYVLPQQDRMATGDQIYISHRRARGYRLGYDVLHLNTTGSRVLASCCTFVTI
jgi:hypothetical protein